jgi:Cu(I)-responsive transcriptional regulator
MRRHVRRPELAAARGQGLHHIGDAAARSGVSAKMIRHYESLGLLTPAGRSVANYRLYSDADLHRLRFIRRARGLGLPLERIASLLGLWDDPQRASARVKALARAHAAELAAKVRELESMQRALETLSAHCHGDARPECPILDDLAAAGRAESVQSPAATTKAARTRRH